MKKILIIALVNLHFPLFSQTLELLNVEALRKGSPTKSITVYKKYADDGISDSIPIANYQYNEVGQLISEMQGRIDGIKVTESLKNHTYDATGNKIETVHISQEKYYRVKKMEDGPGILDKHPVPAIKSSSRTSFVYSESGQLGKAIHYFPKEAKDPNSTVTYTYQKGLLMKEVHATVKAPKKDNSRDFFIKYTYNTEGLLIYSFEDRFTKKWEMEHYYSYDANGNLTEDKKIAFKLIDGIPMSLKTYRYDANNRLIWTSESKGFQKCHGEFEYTKSQRTKAIYKTEEGEVMGSIYYEYLEGNLVHELIDAKDSAKNATYFYVYKN